MKALHSLFNTFFKKSHKFIALLYLMTVPVSYAAPGYIKASNTDCQVYEINLATILSVTWSGECLNGYGNGSGKLVRIQNRGDETITFDYQTFLQEGKMNGPTKMVLLNGEIFDGTYMNHAREGFAVHHYPDGGRYEGNFSKGIRSGMGKFYNSNGDRHEGMYLDDVRHGPGKYFFNSGQVLEINFSEGKTNGYGTMLFPSNNRYEGNFRDGTLHGTGVYFDVKRDERYAGSWKEGKRDGPGTYFYSNGNIWKGTYTEGSINEEFAQVTYPNGDRYEGGFSFNYGTRNGEGALYLANGEVLRGVFSSDELIPDYEGIMTSFSFSSSLCQPPGSVELSTAAQINSYRDRHNNYVDCVNSRRTSDNEDFRRLVLSLNGSFKTNDGVTTYNFPFQYGVTNAELNTFTESIKQRVADRRQDVSNAYDASNSRLTIASERLEAEQRNTTRTYIEPLRQPVRQPPNYNRTFENLERLRRGM